MATPEAAETPSESQEAGGSLVVLAVLAAVAGVAVGLVGGGFRWCLERAGELRNAILEWSHTLGDWGLVVPVVAVALGAAIALLFVRWVPLASGSGIQHVEAVNRGEAEAPPLRLLPAKFLGGLLALGSGLVLGREGPTVHMGAVLGAEAGRISKRSKTDIVTLQTSLAGAGLAVAFNAPIGGALFVFEEVTKSFRPRIVVATSVGVAVAVGFSWLILGGKPDFAVTPPDALAITTLPLMVVFGVLTGVLGVCYNKLVLGFLHVADRITRVPKEAVAAGIGAIIGLALFVDPDIAGGGDTLSQTILGGATPAIPLLLLYLGIRFFAGPLSYSAGAPGGLFAPLLAVGALWGVLFAAVSAWIFPTEQLEIPLAIIGMSCFFAATVRAPFTGVVIVIEMTAVTSVAVPMLLAVGCAVLTATLLRSAPIYDDLRKRMLQKTQRARG